MQFCHFMFIPFQSSALRSDIFSSIHFFMLSEELFTFDMEK